jgi:hypothetical protein
MLCVRLSSVIPAYALQQSECFAGCACFSPLCVVGKQDIQFCQCHLCITTWGTCCRLCAGLFSGRCGKQCGVLALHVVAVLVWNCLPGTGPVVEACRLGRLFGVCTAADQEGFDSGVVVSWVIACAHQTCCCMNGSGCLSTLAFSNTGRDGIMGVCTSAWKVVVYNSKPILPALLAYLAGKCCV